MMMLQSAKCALSECCNFDEFGRFLRRKNEIREVEAKTIRLRSFQNNKPMGHIR